MDEDAPPLVQTGPSFWARSHGDGYSPRLGAAVHRIVARETKQMDEIGRYPSTGAPWENGFIFFYIFSFLVLVFPDEKVLFFKQQ